jgi:hypothetical protein
VVIVRGCSRVQHHTPLTDSHRAGVAVLSQATRVLVLCRLSHDLADLDTERKRKTGHVVLMRPVGWEGHHRNLQLFMRPADGRSCNRIH